MDRKKVKIFNTVYLVNFVTTTFSQVRKVDHVLILSLLVQRKMAYNDKGCKIYKRRL